MMSGTHWGHLQLREASHHFCPHLVLEEANHLRL